MEVGFLSRHAGPDPPATSTLPIVTGGAGPQQGAVVGLMGRY